MEDRDFKGVWIPKEIWLDKSLSALDKIILVEIDSLDKKNGCYASNQHFAEFCQCSESAVTKSISKLKSKGYIQQEGFDGRKRFLRSCFAYTCKAESEDNTKQSSKFYEAESENFRGSNIYINNNINNINNTSNNTPIYEEEFESLWKRYPRKDGKKDALRHYTSARKDGVDYQTISDGLDRYLNYIEKAEVNDRYIKGGGSWFCGRHWDDEYKVPKKQLKPGEIDWENV